MKYCMALVAILGALSVAHVSGVTLRSNIRAHGVTDLNKRPVEGGNASVNHSLSLIGGNAAAHPEGLPHFERQYVIDKKRCPTGRMHIGCVLDTQYKQQIWYHDHIAKEDMPTGTATSGVVQMTPELCYEFCHKIEGVQFFGLKRGEQCYCTPFFPQHRQGWPRRVRCDVRRQPF